MATPDAIKETRERNARAVTLRPSVGQGTAATRVRLGADLRCDIEEGSWRLAAGMTDKYGGDGSAPNPGVLGRAALGSCLAIGYVMWAARLQVPITSLEVESRLTSDVCQMFFQLGTADTLTGTFLEAGFTDVRMERISTVLAYESEEQAIGAAFAGGPVAMAYSRFDEPMRQAAHAEYVESIAAFRRGDGYDVPGEFVVVRGERPHRSSSRPHADN